MCTASTWMNGRTPRATPCPQATRWPSRTPWKTRWLASGKLTVPESQRNFATKDNLKLYPEKIAALKAKGAKQVMVYGIGRACHIAFWEPHFAEEYKSYEEWKKEPYRIGANLHPFTIEQTPSPAFAATGR